MKIALILAVIFIPLVLILYYFGFGVTKAGIFILNASYSLPARWKGTLSENFQTPPASCAGIS